MDQLILLPEKDAVRRYFDSRNCRTLFRLLLLFVVTAVLIALVRLGQQRYLWLLVPAANLVLIRGLYAFNEHPLFIRHFRFILVGYLVVQAGLLRLSTPLDHFHPLDFLFPLLLLAFRLPALGAAIPLLAMWSAASGRTLATTELVTGGMDTWLVIGQSMLCALVFVLVRRWTGLEYRELLERWRREQRRWRERTRMQEELGDARKIQLSMLPQKVPKLPWLDVAGISIPASEVGGDYYGYFQLDDSRLALVVADVAGHGMASGLVLSGVRSCLHLLHESPPEPVEILRKIDRVLRETSNRRHFMTMIYALVDHSDQTLTVATAGHPPLLHFHASTGAVAEIGAPSLPLGTPLPANFEQRRVSFAPRDAFLLYSDGIAETESSGQQVYGTERLGHRFADYAAQRSAKEIREILLGDVVNFKGDHEQTDDITVVVARAR